MNYFFTSTLLIIFSINLFAGEVKSLKVMAWNTWGRKHLLDKYKFDGKTARKRVIEIIRDSGADVVTMVETYGATKEVAEDLGFHYYTPGEKANLCIFSRYPIIENGKVPWGIRTVIQVAPRQKLAVYGIWLTSSGSLTYNRMTSDKPFTDEEITKMEKGRYNGIKKLFESDIYKKDLEKVKQIPIILGGDFNSTSHLDFSKKRSFNHNKTGKFPVSLKIEEEQFIDSYRTLHPEITPETLGYTWTTVGKDYWWNHKTGTFDKVRSPEQVLDKRSLWQRIDYIFYRGNLNAADAKVIKYYKNYKNTSFPAFPSDHAAVLTTFEMKLSR